MTEFVESLPTKTSTTSGDASGADVLMCTCFNFWTSCHPTFPRFDSWFFHDTFPTNRFPTATLRRFAADVQCQIVFECRCQHCSTIRFFCGLMHLSVPSPSFPTWELSVTENQCQSVCVCVHPWTKGFLRPLQSGRGARPVTSNLAQRS